MPTNIPVGIPVTNWHPVGSTSVEWVQFCITAASEWQHLNMRKITHGEVKWAVLSRLGSSVAILLSA